MHAAVIALKGGWRWLRRIDGWKKIATVLGRHTVSA
jgi:hypothetical protein